MTNFVLGIKGDEETMTERGGLRDMWMRDWSGERRTRAKDARVGKWLWITVGRKNKASI